MGSYRFNSNTSGAALLALCTLALTGCGAGGSSSGTAANNGTGSTAAAACNTSLFTGGVRDATSAELTSYAKSYSGNTGSFDANFNFTSSGPLLLAFGASGSLSYNTQAQTVTSICYESAVPQLVVHYGTAGHVDLKTDGSFTGVGPDGTTIIQGSAPTAGTSSAPTITNFAPTSGAVGSTVTITGSNFDAFALHNQVSFNGVSATVVSASPTQLVVTVPAGATTGTISVRNIMANSGAGATVTSTTNFTVTTAAPAATTGLTVPGGTALGGGAAIPTKNITSAAAISYTPLVNLPGNIIALTEGGVTATVYDYVNINQIGFGVAQAGLSLGLSPTNGCATSQAGVTPSGPPLCSSVGVTYDRAAGTVTFVNSPMYALLGTCAASCVVNGVLAFAPQ